MPVFYETAFAMVDPDIADMRPVVMVQRRWRPKGAGWRVKHASPIGQAGHVLLVWERQVLEEQREGEGGGRSPSPEPDADGDPERGG